MSHVSHDVPMHLDIAGDGIATLVLDQPRRLNVVDNAFVASMQAHIETLAASTTARVLILRANGPSFCGGGDIHAMQAHRDDLPTFIGTLIDGYHRAILDLQRLDMPIIASVHGAVAGGGVSLALACDLVMAAPTTRFVIAYPKLGVSPDGGLSWFLTQHLGARRSLEALALNANWSAAQALELGLVNRISRDADSLREETLAMARQLLQLTPTSLREYKRLVAAQGVDGLRAHLLREKESFLRCAATPEFIARIDAFLAPRVA